MFISQGFGGIEKKSSSTLHEKWWPFFRKTYTYVSSVLISVDIRRQIEGVTTGEEKKTRKESIGTYHAQKGDL